MPGPSPRAPFDQGLFLTHLNKGKAHFAGARFEEAERELEEAYLLRPRDQSVLNLLGLVYFKQDKFEKAEEVYGKLAAENPDASALFYNLGLIRFKLGRLEEAESSFVKALEISQENPKINFYLGSIYERLGRFQDAIYQYRQAGANLMVRRVESKIAQARPHKTLPPLPVAPRKPEVDTAEFKLRDIQDAVRNRGSNGDLPAKSLQPVSSVLMADGAPPREPDPSSVTAPMAIPSFAGLPTPRAAAEAGPRSHAFRSLEHNLLEISVSGRVFIKMGTIYSYSGNLTFWVKDRRPGGHSALVMITGHGKVILTERDREITFIRVEGETLFVEPGHLLACEETLTPRYAPLSPARPELEFVALDGSGMVALSVKSKPLLLEVAPDLPVSVPAASIISWTGRLAPRILENRQLYEVMSPHPGGGGTLVRLEGAGRLLVEQAPQS
ncbi:MAG TPA: tetratricopeptide repeat protein [Vicinamibacteria bacterium]|nr:tetratricopeptide repeat protein [Vicinamibacteria bacterium]